MNRGNFSLAVNLPLPPPKTGTLLAPKIPSAPDCDISTRYRGGAPTREPFLHHNQPVASSERTKNAASNVVPNADDDTLNARNVEVVITIH